MEKENLDYSSFIEEAKKYETAIREISINIEKLKRELSAVQSKTKKDVPDSQEHSLTEQLNFLAVERVKMLEALNQLSATHQAVSEYLKRVKPEKIN